MHAFETLAVPMGHIGIHWFGQNSYALKDAADDSADRPVLSACAPG